MLVVFGGCEEGGIRVGKGLLGDLGDVLTFANCIALLPLLCACGPGINRLLFCQSSQKARFGVVGSALLVLLL